MSHQYADKYVSQGNQVPAQEHWAIIGSRSIHIPGDERSRTNPGHGYPASSEDCVTYEAYLTEAKFKEALAYKLLQHERVHGIHVTGEQFTLQATVAVSSKQD